MRLLGKGMSVPLAALNFRDLGGLQTGTGHIRSGILFRSEGPKNFAASQLAAVTSLGIRTILDLRSAREREEVPHQWHGAGCRWHGLDVDADLKVFGNEGRTRLLKGPDTQIAIDTMVDTYREIPLAMARHWPLISQTLQQEEFPVLINCTAGKDRTGVAIALLLELAGVPREIILQDYLRSNIFRDNLKRSGELDAGLMASFGFVPPSGQVDALIGVHPDYLDAAWATIDDRWSGVTGYFDHAGVHENAQLKIRQRLTEGSHAADKLGGSI